MPLAFGLFSSNVHEHQFDINTCFAQYHQAFPGSKEFNRARYDPLRHKWLMKIKRGIFIPAKKSDILIPHFRFLKNY